MLKSQAKHMKGCFKAVNKSYLEYEISQIIIFIIYFGLIYV